jgi:RNA polymerase sigma factor (TIGR02999 family)
VEAARRKRRLKRGGDRHRLSLDHRELSIAEPDDDLIALDEALEKLEIKHPERAAVVKLRYFGGLTGDEAAKALGVSPATADRYWTYARAWLLRELSPDSPSS